jgi:hypothetical protein
MGKRQRERIKGDAHPVVVVMTGHAEPRDPLAAVGGAVMVAVRSGDHERPPLHGA